MMRLHSPAGYWAAIWRKKLVRRGEGITVWVVE